MSRPREFHPEPLAEPYVTLSRHTAPVIQPFLKVLLMSCHSSPHGRLVTFVNRITSPLRSALITRASSLLRATPPLVLASVFFLMVFAICHFPSHPKTRFSRSILKPVLSSCRLYTDCHRAHRQVLSRLFLEHRTDPSFDSTYQPNDASSDGSLSFISSTRT